ncbi:MAG: alpha/beta hydrolase, partial [Flavobacteriaceae bacterium]|nr:alpha/beta hydrolase [Flavobacteriaceae bacterium]
NDSVFLEMPRYGGHVGFYDKDGIFYNEKRSLEFIKNV